MVAVRERAGDTAGRVAEAGIHRIVLPMPFRLDPVNVWVIRDDPVVLVDTGPAHPSALDALEAGLRGLGLRLGDLGLVLLTHPHIDHFGLAAAIVRRTGVGVACLGEGAAIAEGWAAWSEAADRWLSERFLRHGVPRDVVDAALRPGWVHRDWAEPVRVDRRLRPGETLSLRDRELRVEHLPGHSPWDTVFVDEESRLALGGDVLLASTPPNALLTMPDPGRPDRPGPLGVYRRSLERLRTFGLAGLLPGHGPVVGDHRALVEKRLAAQRERAAAIEALLEGRAATAHEIAREFWGATAAAWTYATISEVVGHLDLLVAESRVTCEDDGRVLRFTRRRTGGPAT